MLRGQSIGIFDSGIGGLTVFRALAKLLPEEQIHYLGDTARVPYGTKSPHVVENYAMACARFLVKHQIKLLIVACNTASAVAIESLKQHFDIPILGVIEPGAQSAAKQARHKVGVIATESTINSQRYPLLIKRYKPELEVYSRACPLFVPLAEEGLIDHPATQLIAQEYLQPLLEAKIDTLVLGCTHYPILTQSLKAICGGSINIIDSAKVVAQTTADILNAKNHLTTERRQPNKIFVTDDNSRFHRVGKAFFGSELPDVQWVDLSSPETQ
jgi:glutamate racemase